jgi:hypothetical protein
VRLEDLDAVRERYRYMLSQVEAPSEDLERAGDALARLFAR